jgi:aspartate/methionine/tyrosine aminotransferase
MSIANNYHSHRQPCWQSLLQGGAAEDWRPVCEEIIILSDEVYDRLFYVPFTRMSTLSPEIEQLTITVGSAGKNFYATGWRVGMI